jgi:hypothetical protein
MDWIMKTFFLSLGSILTVIISSLFNVFYDRINYKREIRKEFIKKRIAAYGEIEEIIGSISMSLKYADGYCHNIFIKKLAFQNFTLHLGLSLKFNIWYSHAIQELLIELNKIQLLILDNADYDFTENSQCYQSKLEMGKKMYNEILIIRGKLRNNISIDYMNMHKTKSNRITETKK